MDNTNIKKDEIFSSQIQRVSDFKFNSHVVGVFDDMVNRSVPFYGEIQRMIAEFPGTKLTLIFKTQ